MSPATRGSRERTRSRTDHHRVEVPTVRAPSSGSDSPAARTQPLNREPESSQAMSSDRVARAVFAGVLPLRNQGPGGLGGADAVEAIRGTLPGTRTRHLGAWEEDRKGNECGGGGLRRAQPSLHMS